MERIPQETYDFTLLNEIELLQEITVHEAVDSEETFTMAPQTIRIIQTDATFTWICLETGEGKKGWLKMEGYDKIDDVTTATDVFDGLIRVD